MGKREMVIEAFEEGQSRQEVATRFKVPYGTVCDWIRQECDCIRQEPRRNIPPALSLAVPGVLTAVAKHVALSKGLVGVARIVGRFDDEFAPVYNRDGLLEVGDPVRLSTLKPIVEEAEALLTQPGGSR